MKKFYEAPEAVEIIFEAEDIMNASDGDLGDITTEDDPNGGWGGFH